MAAPKEKGRSRRRVRKKRQRTTRQRQELRSTTPSSPDRHRGQRDRLGSPRGKRRVFQGLPEVDAVFAGRSGDRRRPPPRKGMGARSREGRGVPKGRRLRRRPRFAAFQAGGGGPRRDGTVSKDAHPSGGTTVPAQREAEARSDGRDTTSAQCKQLRPGAGGPKLFLKGRPLLHGQSCGVGRADRIPPPERHAEAANCRQSDSTGCSSAKKGARKARRYYPVAGGNSSGAITTKASRQEGRHG